jgi:glycosyltransferase involved in cell wall biosynthesis
MVTPLTPTKSLSSNVPVYSSDALSGLLRRTYERTPRISIVTDAEDIRSIPAEILEIAGEELRVTRDFAQWSKSKGKSEAALVWLADERLLEGAARGLLKSLHVSNRRTFVVVNTPCVEHVPFLTMQPRMFASPASVDHSNFRIRIESAGTATTKLMVDPDRPVELWARLVEAIGSEQAKLGSGVEMLTRLWEERDNLPDVIAALVMRNIFAVMLLHREAGKARAFLEAGVKLYPTYAELHYLAGLLAVREERFGEAIPYLNRAKSSAATFPGSGGESTYRCDWLMGVLAVQVGNGRLAFEHFLAGVKQNPPFEPSLTELLKLDLPQSVIEDSQYVFARACRLNPKLAPRIFEYLLAHRSIDAACRVARTSPVSDVVREDFENRLEMEIAETRGSPQNSSTKLNHSRRWAAATGVVFEGPFLEHSSLARVNREVACALQGSSAFEVSIEPSSLSGLPARFLPNGESLVECSSKRLRHVDLTVRHQWPPNFCRPKAGKLAVIFPWEFGGVPRVWIEQIQRNVDELWVPSNFVREVMVRSGVSAERVAVIPNGYDPTIFKPDGRVFRPYGCRDCIFLFVGGAIARKGIDLILRAARSAFLPTANVTFAFLVSGSSGAYQHNSLIAEIRAAANDPALPHVLPIFETVNDLTLAELYRGATVLVLPYRGEGFGMPLLEAMACGKPVITTREGPSKDFCDDFYSYLIPATTVPVPDQLPPLGPMAGEFTWFEPGLVELARIFGHVYENQAEAAAIGRIAAEAVSHLTWGKVADQYSARIQQLCNTH